jgi:hypothetical protein
MEDLVGEEKGGSGVLWQKLVHSRRLKTRATKSFSSLLSLKLRNE